MSYYHLPTNTERSPGRLELKAPSGDRLSPPDTGWTPELAALCGFVVVVNTARPSDTASVTYDRSIVVAGQVATETWTQRPKTQAELDADTANTNRSAIVTNLTSDMAAIQAIINDTNANINANPAAAIKTMARMLRRLGRQNLNDFTGIT